MPQSTTHRLANKTESVRKRFRNLFNEYCQECLVFVRYSLGDPTVAGQRRGPRATGRNPSSPESHELPSANSGAIWKRLRTPVPVGAKSFPDLPAIQLDRTLVDIRVFGKRTFDAIQTSLESHRMAFTQKSPEMLKLKVSFESANLVLGPIIETDNMSPAR